MTKMLSPGYNEKEIQGPLGITTQLKNNNVRFDSLIQVIKPPVNSSSFYAT